MNADCFLPDDDSAPEDGDARLGLLFLVALGGLFGCVTALWLCGWPA